MSNKPRLLMVSTTFPRWERDSGPAPFVFDLAQGLEQYFEITVLAPHFPGAARHEVWKGVEIYRFQYLPGKWEFLSDGQGLQNHLRARKTAWLAMVPFLLAEFFAGLSLIRRRRFDAVNSHWLVPSGLIIGIICRLFGIKHVVTVHAADYFLLSRVPAGKFIIRTIAKWSHALIPVNWKMADGIKQIWAGAKVLVMPMGFEPEKFWNPDPVELEKRKHEIESEAKPLLLFVGKLTEKKGVPILIEAIKLLEKDFPDLRLAIVGDGRLRPDLEAQTKKMGLSDRITFLGAVPHDRVSLLYHLADAVAVPSIPDRHGESEGMPVVVLEALASGRPVVGTVYCSVPEELKRGGFVEIATADAAAIADAVRKILSGGLQADFKIVDKYSWPQVAKFYAEVIAG